MCGIALIVSAIRITSSSLTSPPPATEKLSFSVDDVKEALRRRGPDSLGVKKVSLQRSVLGRNHISSSFIAAGDEGQEFCSQGNDNNGECTAQLHFIGATLQLRGSNPLVQPLVDASGNVLVYNGEIFGGLDIASDCNDAEFLLQTLGRCCSCGYCATAQCARSGKSTVPDVLSTIKGPWAIIYWQVTRSGKFLFVQILGSICFFCANHEDSSRTLWFGRDAFGRRSLLVHWPTQDDCTFLLSSVSPIFPTEQTSEYETHNGLSCPSYWEELPCGIYSLDVDGSKSNGHMAGELKLHEYTNSMLKELIKWERTSIEPNSEDLQIYKCSTQSTIPVPAHVLLNALHESVLRRTSMYTIYQVSSTKENFVPVAILFSGGLDSMILAALLDQCLDQSYQIDLLNVSFDGQFAPDRISAKAGLKELKRVAPSRRWRLVEIDSELSDLVFETSHVMSLINPANTYMDLNIGIALWLAAGGDGWVSGANIDDNDDENPARAKYKSTARILLVGSGADEQCAGYGRHRTSYRRGSWLGLHEEMKLDMQRIWKRNLGRDDRCIADNGKEARFPFLDEDVIRVLLNFPLWEIANLDQPSGLGDKRILREVAGLLGLNEAAILPKRAIQFGSRIARESNRKNFGSNRAANQASAGSVRIDKRSNYS
ncbi:hypothetical protein Ahy_B03g062488 isoform A [Arachis hypogaea]|uniref:Asparagine synthetase domain-containing protein n=1 Tax=Arachis hypogaea TaxID=3818 RepID=A0A444ZU95_ARAHY|nr:hypothetical protein Ahy_B03g062488 isoform A [Arachis hypogaea]